MIVIYTGRHGWVTDSGGTITLRSDPSVVVLERYGAWKVVHGKPQVVLVTDNLDDAKQCVEEN